ncbi:MAG: 23S rRNA (uracil(1939)-C(5))-methyltransferase RlmD [Eggerthellaceae bacterium]|nr:23S rRNA (uracil(1939)-C(5))-methyltransferase RlmD [Eggerthellaceae bacterium]
MSEIVKVERMGYGPDAIAHLSTGKTVFVRGGIPGDLLNVVIEKQKPNYDVARIASIIEPSKERLEIPWVTPMPWCPWSAFEYPAQLKTKRSFVIEALVRVAHISRLRAEKLVLDTLACKREWGYRNKIELATVRDEKGLLTVGHYDEADDKVIPVESSPLAVNPIEDAPKALQGALRFLEGSSDLKIYRVGVRSSLRTRQTEIALWTPPSPFPRAAAVRTLKNALANTSLVRVIADPGSSRKVKNVEILSGKGYWTEKLAGDLTFMTSAPSFFQVNTAQADRLIALVLEGLEPHADDVIVDLYAGGGTFSIPLARAGANVTAVESASSSVRDFKRNAKNNDVKIEVIGGDAKREIANFRGMDALVVDPPRAGLEDGMAEAIAEASPKRIAYVSCDPQTWARDAARLEKEGFALTKVFPVDMFPQTYHVETVSFFVRS